MKRRCKRIISFEVELEVYDKKTDPEDILADYSYIFKDYNDGIDKCFLVFDHKDARGRITKMTRLSDVKKSKKPEIKYLIM